MEIRQEARAQTEEATVKTEKTNLDYMLEREFTGFGDRLQSKQKRETPRASPKLLA